MQPMKRINQNPAEQDVQNFLAASNAYAHQCILNGEENIKPITKAQARNAYQQCIKTAIALSDPSNSKHSMAYNAMVSEFGKRAELIDSMAAIGESFLTRSRALAESYVKAGMSPEKAVEGAFNSLAGNPVFDHFGNLNLLAGQMYQEATFMEAFQSSGDSFAVPTEPGGTGSDTSRFRAPVEQVSGSSKIKQGDINPTSNMRVDNNRTQVSLYNEFKNAITIGSAFSITQAMRDQALGYERAVNPAMAGFILQSRYFTAAQKQDMKLAELMMVGGQQAGGTYTPNVGGNYGFLSSAIWLTLGSSGDVSPATASTADWLAAPTKLIQKLENAIYKPTTVAAQLDASVDPIKMYKEIVRAFGVLALQNIDFTAQKWALFVPTTWYAFAVQYPATGTFNKMLQEMVSQATGGKINAIEVLPSALMNYGANIGNGQTNAYNYMVICAMGCRPENKPVIVPGQTALPIVVSQNVSASIMDFATEFMTGGPMVMHYGGSLVLQFSVAAS